MRCGIDLGSRSVKLVILDDAKQLKSTNIYETARFYRDYGHRTEAGLAVDFAALGYREVTRLTATGYGRNTIELVGATVIPELKAHMLGAIAQTGLTDFTLLDLGGQDSKVIKVRKGRMADFQTNDKCAASTGRYLENMAAVLDISLEELANYSVNPVELSATCAIFGESELIGRIVEGYSIAELAAGVNYTIYKRIKPMLVAMRSDKLVFTGGVALGGAIKEFITREMDIEVIVPEYPQLNGAIGCAVYES
ncbi:acyl-CoA dehydratase activase [Sporomusa acidovorans]|uniref:2-hydroxyisocaproyl-CoA dehydratase activator n=1 Tax=Sporomusa acidovorans (strain ATCC 49682 / DSM 3132 / Mol) TaxID=1123286 RepID=A0ABZ3J009_SPOA4|nr:acyl-CoA dehydratase activase [Sporomusa acidovorans]OZC21350.1 activator of (R)-2-hydroxyglutaryl-CoA dehydratase [Sporomusa acidovorans DSM 3132]SDE56618.1 CoA-substrate-specific enzyme activase, putative [Sporomusa acidovorans]